MMGYKAAVSRDLPAVKVIEDGFSQHGSSDSISSEVLLKRESSLLPLPEKESSRPSAFEKESSHPVSRDLLAIKLVADWISQHGMLLSERESSLLPLVEKESSHPVSKGLLALMHSLSSEILSERKSPLLPLPEMESSRPSASEKESSHPDCLMLDCVLRRARGDDFKSCTMACECTSNYTISVGVRAVEPPRISYLFFALSPSPIEKRSNDPCPLLLDAKAVAAHGSYVLLRIVTRSVDRHKICEEFFVYKASPVPSLTGLPACGHGTINLGLRNNIGILSRGSGQFAVAHLTVTQKKGKAKNVGCPITAHLCCMLEGSLDGWISLKDLPIRCSEGNAKDLFWWATDTVVAFGDFICWVDYLRGILFCNVFSSNPEIEYVPLPVYPYPSDEDLVFGGRGVLFPYRNVCVTKDGCAIKFVDVACRDFWFYGPACCCSSPSAITSYTLSRDRLTWIKDGEMKADEFSSLTKHLNLPETQLEFPLVHFKDPQTIYVVFRDYSDCKAFQITVNMTSKEIGGPICYSLNWSDEDGSHSDTASFNLYHNLPFIPFEPPKYKPTMPTLLAVSREGPVEVLHQLPKLKDNVKEFYC